MDLRKIITLQYKKVDLLQTEIDKLKKEQSNVRSTITVYKNKLVEENNFLLGKKAICSGLAIGDNVECVCTAIKCDDWLKITPLFSNAVGKKVSVDTYQFQ